MGMKKRYILSTFSCMHEPCNVSILKAELCCNLFLICCISCDSVVMIAVSKVLILICKLIKESYLLFAEIFNRFDGVAVGIPDENLYNWNLLVYQHFRTEKYEEDLDTAMVFALRYFLPKWKGFMLEKDMSCHTCKDALDCIDSIHKGFWSNYGKRFKKWRQDYMKFKKHIGMVRSINIFSSICFSNNVYIFKKLIQIQYSS